MGLGSSFRRVVSRGAWVPFGGGTLSSTWLSLTLAIVDMDRGTKYLYGPGCRSRSGDHDTKVP
jgi:hypothetical protein